MLLRIMGAFLILISLLALIGNFIAPTGTVENILLTYFGMENAWTESLVIGIGLPLLLAFIGSILYRLG